MGATRKSTLVSGVTVEVTLDYSLELGFRRSIKYGPKDSLSLTLYYLRKLQNLVIQNLMKQYVFI